MTHSNQVEIRNKNGNGTDILFYDIDSSRYVNLTNACTLGCKFCPKNQRSFVVHDYNLSLSQNYPAQTYIENIGDPANFSEIVFCGFGEPTIRLTELLKIAAFIKEIGGQTRINTDGLANLVHKRNVLPDMHGVIDALSVSLNAQDEQTYNLHCAPNLAGSFSAMLSFLEQAPNYIPCVTATAIDGLPGVNIEECEKLAHSLGVKFRRRYLDLVG